MEDHHTVAGAIVLDAFSGCSDYAGGFMPKDAGRGMRTGGNLFEVGATDAAGVDADEHFSNAYFGNGDGLQADVVYAAVHRSQHGGRDGARVRFERKLSGCGH
jgi:hypothetical protein